MKRILAALFIISSMVLFSDDAQKEPVFAKKSIAEKKAMVFVKAKTVFIMEPGGKNIGGVVVRPESIINENGNMVENDNNETFFVSGVDLDKITDGSYVYHKKAGINECPFLTVWRIGNIKVIKNESAIHLKKFTVDPKEAMAYLGK